MGFGQYEVSAAGTQIEDGVYDAIIESVTVVTGPDGTPSLTRTDDASKPGKHQADVYFVVDRETKLRRRYAISFGQNSQNKQWAAFAKLLEAATGVKCGDPAQKKVGEEDLTGKRIRIVVETNDRGYSDVTNVLPAGARKPQPVAAKPVSDEPGAFSEEDFLGLERR